MEQFPSSPDPARGSSAKRWMGLAKNRALLRAAWVPIPLLLAGILVARGTGFSGLHESRYLLALLNLVFLGLVSIVAIWAITRHYLAVGAPSYLVLGCGLVLWAMAGIGSLAVAGEDPNALVTTHNLGVLLSSLCHAAGALLVRRRGPERARLSPRWMWPAYGAAAAISLGVALSARQGWIVPFFIQGQGGTLVRQLVLGAAMLLFACTAFLMWRVEERTPFHTWYALALGLIVTGLVGILLQSSAGSAVGWVGRAAQYLAGLYLFMAVLAEAPGAFGQEIDRSEAGLGFFTAVMLVVSAGAMRECMTPVLGRDHPFMAFFPAVILAGFFGAAWPGLLATVLSMAVYGLWIQGHGFLPLDGEAWLEAAGFLAKSVLVVLVLEAMHRARRRALASEARAVAATVRAEGEEALRRTVDELTRSNRDLEQYAYVASHDLQEPLRMVRAFLSLLRESHEGLLDAKARGYIAAASAGAERCQALIQALLEYSRAGSENGNAGEPIELGGCLARALEGLQGALAECGGRVTWDPLPSVPADPVQMTQIFSNLLGNAFKFRGAQAPQVHVGALAREGGVEIFVRDNGIGIDPRAHGKVFEIFHRLQPREDFPGTGIGLAICKKLVERRGGRIWVESRPGEGATFRFSIPDSAGRRLL